MGQYPERENSDEEINNNVLKVAFDDAPVIDFMRDKTSAVIGSYSKDMKVSIRNELFSKHQ